MRREVLEKRLRWLEANEFPILALEEGVERLRSGTLPDNAVVITVDDGFASVAELAMPLFRDFGITITLYVTTYYCKHPNPIFRLAVQYMFWRTTKSSLDTAGILEDGGKVEIRDVTPSSDVVWRIIDYGESSLDELERQDLLQRLGDRLDVDYEELHRARLLSLVTTAELNELVAAGVDVQLHTHRHTLPTDASGLEREINENRAFLEPIAGKSLNHLCYPSGEWVEEHLPLLGKLGVRTATTCMVGMNDPDTHPLTLNRLLDADDLTQLEFEAEVTGFLELLRRIRGKQLKHVG